MKRKLLFVVCIFCCGATAFAQRVYDNFEGTMKIVRYWEMSGQMDSAVVNTMTNAVNSSATCAKYIRNHNLNYDYLKIGLDSAVDVTNYIGLLAPKKMKMKIHTKAPINTQIEIQAGKRTTALDTNFKTSTHSLYRATTTLQNQWEELTFYFLGYVDSTINPAEINKLVLLVSPNDTNYTQPMKTLRDTIYIDDLMGPEYSVTMSVNNPENKGFALLQNSPNPAMGVTTIQYTITAPGDASLVLYNMLGERVRTLNEQYMQPGSYSASLNVADLTSGVYFYELKVNGSSEVKKMVVGTR